MGVETNAPNFSVEQMAAGGTGLASRALGARRHRSPLRSASHMRPALVTFVWLLLLGCSAPRHSDERVSAAPPIVGGTHTEAQPP